MIKLQAICSALVVALLIETSPVFGATGIAGDLGSSTFNGVPVLDFVDNSYQSASEGSCTIPATGSGDCSPFQAYCKSGSTNVACPTSHCPLNIGSTCGGNVCFMGLSQDDANVLVQAHNDLRRKVAKGQESRGSPGPQPGAEMMMELQWDPELATLAQSWVNLCNTNHDLNDNRKRASDTTESIGQNMAQNMNIFSPTKELKSMVQMWYDEVDLMSPNTVASFDMSALYSVGHYTQVVSAKTEKVGCGYAKYLNNGWYNELLFCNYGPGGNVLNEPIYVSGTPDASKCPAGTRFNDGLCARG